MREVSMIQCIGFVGGNRKLVGSRTADIFGEFLYIKSILDEMVSKCLEQCGVGGWIADTKIIDRIDDPSTQEVSPNNVANVFCERTVCQEK